MISNIVTVYRVENALGHGPYRALALEHTDEEIDEIEDPFEKMKSDHSWTSRESHPTPYMDFKRILVEKHIADNPKAKFGFPNLEKLHEWFNGYISLLKENGFEIKTYQVARRKIRMSNSGKQLVFFLD